MVGSVTAGTPNKSRLTRQQGFLKVTAVGAKAPFDYAGECVQASDLLPLVRDWDSMSRHEDTRTAAGLPPGDRADA